MDNEDKEWDGDNGPPESRNNAIAVPKTMNDFRRYDRARESWDSAEKTIKIIDVGEVRDRKYVTFRRKTAEARLAKTIELASSIWKSLLSYGIDYPKCKRALKRPPIPDLAIEFFSKLYPDHVDLIDQLKKHFLEMEAQDGQAPAALPQLLRAKKALPARKLSREERRDYAIEKGAFTLERGMQHLTWSLGDKDVVEVYSGKFDHRIWWVLLVAAAKVLESKAQPLFSSVEELQGVYDYIWRLDSKNRQDLTPVSYFSDYDFNRILRKNLSSKHIENIVGLLPKLVFRINHFEGLKVVEQAGKEGWKEYAVSDIHAFAGVRIVKTKRKKRGLGAGTEERAYSGLPPIISPDLA